MAGYPSPGGSYPPPFPPPPPPPPPWAYYYRYPNYPPPRPDNTVETALIVVVVVVASVGVPALFAFAILGFASGGFCVHCPGATPVGAAIALDNSTLFCSNVTGGPKHCDYRFNVLAVAAPLAPQDLDLVLEDSNGSYHNGLVANASVVDRTGCTISVWVFQSSPASLGQWTAPSASQRCSNLTASSLLAPGDQFVLNPLISSSASLSVRGYQLVLIGVGNTFTGTIAVAIP